MQDKQETPGLLEYLSKEVGCGYISDLCQSSCLPKIQEAVRRMDQHRYDLRQWSDAVSYITKEKIQKDTVDEYIDYLFRL